MRSTPLLVLAALLLASVLQAQGSDPAAAGDELVREKGRFKQTSVHPDADLSRYHKLVLTDVVFQFSGDESPRTGSLISSRSRQDVQEEHARFRQVFSDALVTELESCGTLQLVEQAGPGTLVLRTSVLDIAPNIPPQTAGRVDTYLWYLGDAELSFELAGGESGMLLARFAGRREIRSPAEGPNIALTMPTHSTRVWIDIERWASRAATDLRRELEARQGQGQER